ncbi:NAD-dependent epimerase/dehydratase family protein [Sphingomonas changnyeongensis]|uniref:NAD-dependent epimerase/dehydratase family protein n=1 Tax=Sphingomonas changnyeongensis TaxID=2698679 RepID=A0A7Z2S8Z0_9SPHN|nr:NAD-dependent epimerase/dehydratase family protein [Sphingomonas changnyeongensis]QHL90224.1 NAD-dependent epimerase/dehydratase family protein [Sphingomonas changnyeongensis]
MKKILVTGAAGFIGAHLVAQLLDDGLTVRALDNLSTQIHGPDGAFPAWQDHPGVEIMRASITEDGVWDQALDGVDAVVHLAAETGTGQSMYEIARYSAVNTQATAALMEAVAQRADTIRRIVLSSSRSIYGEGAFSCPACGLDPVHPAPRTAEAMRRGEWDQPCPRCGAPMNMQPTREDAPPRPASVYAATKLAQEDLVSIVAGANRIPAAILRFQNVYGEGQSLNNPYTGILSIFSTRIRRGLDLPIFEDGEETRDFVHVSDVVAAIRAALRAPEDVSGTFNVGSGVATSIRDVAKHLNDAFGGSSTIRVTGEFRVGDIRHNVADLARLRTVLGVEPKIDLPSGLARFARWVLTQPLPEDRLAQANEELRARRLMG